MAKRKSQRRVKVVSVQYTLFTDQPNNRRIEQAIDRWMNEGYVLQSRQENTPSGCTRILSLFWARGRTELTFVKAPDAETKS